MKIYVIIDFSERLYVLKVFSVWSDAEEFAEKHPGSFIQVW